VRKTAALSIAKIYQTSP
jgi:vesicle coat complex subunit